ncbi:hypothetical protein B5X24_HaOG200816 [Helicoverpa armigera]|nr:hypothetical protein B5X24_HaOG200816 [Helicoverpa armigera]
MAYLQKNLHIVKFLEPLMSVKTIMLIRISGGFYHKISSNKLISCITALYCLAITAFLSVNLLTLNYPSYFILVKNYVGFLIYYLLVGICLLTDSGYFQNFLNEIKKIDHMLGASSNIKVPISSFLLLGIITGVTGMDVLYVIYEVENNRQEKGFFITLFCMSLLVQTCAIANYTNVMAFELLWYRMRIFKQFLENTLKREFRSQDEEIKINAVRNCMVLYQRILDTVNKNNLPMKLLTFVLVTKFIPKTVATLYDIVTNAIPEVSYMLIHEFFVDFMVLCAPAIFADLICGEISSIKSMFKKQLLTCQGTFTNCYLVLAKKRSQ